MKSSDPLLAAWDETLARKGNAPAIFATTGEVVHTFDQIEVQAREFTRGIDNFRAGDVLAVQIGNHEDWPSILIACLRKKIVVLPLEQSMSDQQRESALEICSGSAIVSGSAGILPAVHRILRRTPLPRAECGTQYAGTVRSTSLLKLTSGTTASPRTIRFRSEQLLADCNQICDTMGISDVDLNFGVIPVSHSYGFSNLLTPLIARGVAMVLSRDRTPRAVLTDLAWTNATVFPGMPLFYQAFCEIEEIPQLTQLRLCISAGAPLPAAIAKRFFEKFRQPIHSFYGSSECGGICYDRNGMKFEDGFVGPPMKKVDLEMIDPSATSTQIRVRSAAVGDGYFPEPDEEKLGKGIFAPDDLLVRTDSGFKIVGRISDVINVAGKKVNPAEVETQLLKFPGVRQAVVFGRQSPLRNEEVAACVVADVDPANGRRATLRESDLLEFCRATLSGWQTPKRVFIVEEIPTSERGKISRRELAQRFAT